MHNPRLINWSLLGKGAKAAFGGKRTNKLKFAWWDETKALRISAALFLCMIFLFQFKCAGIKPVVSPLLGNQILVSSPLNNPTLL